MKKVLDIKKFTYLFLATLAKKTRIIQLDAKNKHILACRLPVNFKQNIQNIMCEQNGWAEKFSNLIDVEEYFYDHFAWEHKFSKTIEEVLKELNKKHTYDIKYDSFCIDFTEKEVDLILRKFTTPVKDNMDHFVNLVIDYIYTREYQENFHDTNAKSIKFMHELNRSRYENYSKHSEFMREIKQKAYGDDEVTK